jgi:hypothetical protein
LTRRKPAPRDANLTTTDLRQTIDQIRKAKYPNDDESTNDAIAAWRQALQSWNDISLAMDAAARGSPIPDRVSVSTGTLSPGRCGPNIVMADRHSH